MLSQWLLKLICVVECVYESAHTHTHTIFDAVVVYSRRNDDNQIKGTIPCG